MTEPEWQSCTDPQTMLGWLRGQASERKMRLFAVACCRHAWPDLADDLCRTAVDIAERYADEQASPRELKAAKASVSRELGGLPSDFGPRFFQMAAIRLLVSDKIDSPTPVEELAALAAQGRGGGRKMVQEMAHQCDLLRDIFSNPFNSVASDPSWRTSTVVALTQSIYDEHAFDRLPILADALEEAGCNVLDVLDHCRRSRVHTRGCWVTDGLLGKG
jgi:hypothetical protein